MEQSESERKRNEELITFIKCKNDISIMPSTRDIYKAVDMSKATALKYLSVLRAKDIVEYSKVGPTRQWYMAKDEKGNTIIPRIIFAVK